MRKQRVLLWRRLGLSHDGQVGTTEGWHWQPERTEHIACPTTPNTRAICKTNELALDKLREQGIDACHGMLLIESANDAQGELVAGLLGKHDADHSRGPAGVPWLQRGKLPCGVGFGAELAPNSDWQCDFDIGRDLQGGPLSRAMMG